MFSDLQMMMARWIFDRLGQVPNEELMPEHIDMWMDDFWSLVKDSLGELQQVLEDRETQENQS